MQSPGTLMLTGAVAALALFVPNATATTLLPGDTVFPSLLTGSAGTLLAVTSITFSTATYNANLVAAVFRISAATAVCPAANCVNFYYQITNLPTTTTGQLARLTDFVFTGFATDVAYRTDNAGNAALFVAGSKAPVTADRTIAGDVAGFS